MFRAVVLAGCSLVGCGDEPVEVPREVPREEPVVQEPVVQEPVMQEPVAEAEPEAESEGEAEPEPEADPPPRMRPTMERTAEAPCPPGSERDTPPCFFIL